MDVKPKVLEAYGKLAMDYEMNIDAASGFNAFYERPAMMRLVPENLGGQVVLDAGCAAGWYTEQFINRGARVTAMDMTPQMVRATRRRVGSKATVLEQDLCEPLTFEDDTFDLILSSLTLHYVEEWGPTFQEFYRVLKPAGRLLYSVHHPFMDFHLFNREHYFTRELLEDVWDKQEAGRVEVTFFRRTLAEIINTTTKYFSIDQIVEPQPTNDFKTNLPDRVHQYDYLMNKPHFLLVESHRPVRRR